VFEVETDRLAMLEDVPLTGLCLTDAKDAVNALALSGVIIPF
jgi:hypothetical protein